MAPENRKKRRPAEIRARIESPPARPADRRADPAETELAPNTLADELTRYSLEIGTDPDELMETMDEHFTDDDVRADFAGRQQLGSQGDALLARMLEHNAKTPELSGGDVDAAWEDAGVSGEASVGSTVATPDQDVVDELGEALGITYADDEPLRTADKLDARDRQRWELDPRSAADLEEAEDLP